MNPLAIVLRLLLGLLLDELLSWVPGIIQFSVKILPKEYQERYEEEFQAALYRVNGRLCKFVRAVEFIWVAWQVRKELFGPYTGNFAYSLIDHQNGDQYTGTCTLRSSFLGLFFVTGHLLTRCTNKDGYWDTRKESIPWKSYAVSLRQDNLIVRYKIQIDGKLTNGRYEIELDEGNLHGELNRAPVEEGRFQLWRRPPCSRWSDFRAHTTFLWDYFLQKWLNCWNKRVDT